MTEKLKQTIREEIIKLPKETQEAIGSLDWVNITEEIGKKYRLSESEINDLQVETMLVLIGFEDPDLYTSNIEDNIGTTNDEAKRITEEVFQKVFTLINNNLIENIKKNSKTKNPNWKQTLGFVLSGGDYSSFMEKDNTISNINTILKTTTLDNSSKITDIKSKFTI